MDSKINSEKEYLFDLPKIEDARGNLSFLEEGSSVSFSIARVYWIYDVPGGQIRGSHAFKTQREIIIALSGSFEVVLNDGKKERKYQLNRSFKALYVPSKIWRRLENFATNSVCLILSSGKYDEEEYIRNFKDYKSFLKNEEQKVIEEQKSDSLPIASTPPVPLKHNSVFDCSVIELSLIKNRAGNLTPIHNWVDIPFKVKRIFFVYDIPFGKTRGMHAHRTCHEFLIAVSGSFDVELEDGKSKRLVSLNRPTQGVHVLPGIWTKETNYSSGAVCLVLASETYTESDYIRKYADFKQLYGTGRDKEI